MTGATIAVFIVLAAAAVLLVLHVRRNAARARPKAERSADVVAEFWRWWARSRDRLTRQARNGELAAVREVLAPRIAELDRSIPFELAATAGKSCELVFGYHGSLAVRRRLARLQAIAPDDRDWQFSVGRGKSDRAVIDGIDLDVAHASFLAEEVLGGAMLDVTLHHPKFTELPADQKAIAAHLLLVSALGEDEVERWIRAIHATKVPGEAMRPLGSFAEEIERRCRSRGDLAVIMLRDENVAPVLVTVFTTVKPLDALACDHHLQLICRSSSDGGASVEWLQQRESELLERLRDKGVRVARELGPERRIVHLYVSVEGRDIVRKWSTQSPQASVVAAIDVAADPEWNWYDDLLSDAEYASSPTPN
jgi:hypothetical protein